MPVYSIPISHRGTEGRINAWVVVADTYVALAASDPVEINGILTTGTSRKDLDIDVGIQGADELELTVDPRAIVTEDDQAGYDFIVAAQESSLDPAKKRYVGVILQPATPGVIDPDDFEFRGVIMADAFRGKDLEWNDDEYGSNPSPPRVWEMTATSYEVADIADADIESLVEEIEPEWIDTHVDDVLGWFFAEDEYGRREGRYGEMCITGTVLQKLIDIAAEGTGVTITLQDTLCDFKTWVPFLRGIRYGNDEPTRYGGMPVSHLSNYPWEFFPAPYDISLKDAGGLNTMWTSWRLLQPSKSARPYSWLQYKSLTDLIYGIALSLGMYVEWEYVDNATINLRLRSRTEIGVNPQVYIRDVSGQPSLDLKTLDGKKKPRYRAVACAYAQEGMNVYYHYDGGFLPSQGFNVDGEAETVLPLSIGPAMCALHRMGVDAGYDFADDFFGTKATIPHNGVFWKNLARETAAETNLLDPRFNTVDATTAIYNIIVAPERPGGGGDVDGCQGKIVVRPIGAISVWKEQPGGGTTQINFSTITEYVDWLYTNDLAYYTAEYELEVPYLTGFRSSPSGPDNWRNLKLGYKYEQDGKEFVVVGIEREFHTGITRLRLHYAGRFSFAAPVTTEEPAGGAGDPPGAISSDDTMVSVIKRFDAGEAFGRYTAVLTWTDEQIYTARPNTYGFGRVAGIALDESTGAGDVVRVLTSGPLTFDADYGLMPGVPIYLRDPDSPDAILNNLSSIPLRGDLGTEFLHYQLGAMLTPRLAIINIGKHHYTRESVPDYSLDPEELT